MATKKRKYPKTPKASSSLDVWRNHEAKCKEVDKYNADIEREKNAKKSLIAKVKKQKAKR